MADEFISFQRFSDKNLAAQLVAVLENHKIQYRFEDNSLSVDSSFGGGGFTNEYVVKLRKTDFGKADHILIEDTIADLDAIDKDYYLLSFTDDELRDVVAQSDEWNKFDFLLAQKLLKERGHEISTEQLAVLRKERLEELAKPEKSQTASIIAGYILAFLGGFLGIFIGWYLKTHKKTLPNGETVYNYSESDRHNGKNIMYIGIFFLIFWIFFRLYLFPRMAAAGLSIDHG